MGNYHSQTFHHNSDSSSGILHIFYLFLELVIL